MTGGFECYKRYIWKEGTLWAVCYNIGSVSEKVTTEIVKEYIENQKSEEDEQERVREVKVGALRPPLPNQC